MQNLNNQNGVAMLTVVFVLALITLAGLMVSKTTTTELQIATIDQLNKIAFYAAEAAQYYVMLNADLYGASNIDPVPSAHYLERLRKHLGQFRTVYTQQLTIGPGRVCKGAQHIENRT